MVELSKDYVTSTPQLAWDLIYLLLCSFVGVQVQPQHDFKRTSVHCCRIKHIEDDCGIDAVGRCVITYATHTQYHRLSAGRSCSHTVQKQAYQSK